MRKEKTIIETFNGRLKPKYQESKIKYHGKKSKGVYMAGGHEITKWGKEKELTSQVEDKLTSGVDFDIQRSIFNNHASSNDQKTVSDKVVSAMRTEEKLNRDITKFLNNKILIK